jgi:RNA polymerase sigma-70 factor (ECF subfamily)
MNPSAEHTDDTSLVAAALAGSSSAFSDLFQRHYPQIHVFAFRLTLCPAEAADIAQDTFIQAARSLGSFRQEASFKNWLFTIATHKSRDRHRQKVRRDHIAVQWAAVQDEVEPAADGLTTEAERVQAALRALSPDLRTAVTLVFYEGLSHAAAARVIDCAETTVSWRIFRAKQKLKHHLRHFAVGASHD